MGDTVSAMQARDDGEFELILGNKQLLSVLFIVIVLLGVFFTMGFLAGRSTGGTVAAARPAPADTTPIPVDSASSRAAEPAPPPSRPVEEPRAVEPKAEAPKPEPAKAAAPPAAPPKQAAKSGGFVDAPPAGTYLQAAAARRADAESMLGYINEKTGLTGYITPSPKSAELCRVILGPLKNDSDIAEARVKLGDIGIKNAYPVKY